MAERPVGRISAGSPSPGAGQRGLQLLPLSVCTLELAAPDVRPVQVDSTPLAGIRKLNLPGGKGIVVDVPQWEDVGSIEHYHTVHFGFFGDILNSIEHTCRVVVAVSEQGAYGG